MKLIPALIASLLLAAAPPALGHEGHVHETHEVSAEGAPAISDFRIEKDPAGGWTVTVAVENFTFMPDDAQELPPGHVGHAHLFINGTEFGMFYEPVFHIDELPFGPHDLKLVLSSFEHEDYAIVGRPIEARLTLTVE
ncbi:MAG: hypothetical protein ABS76_00790 [Pelagibacterium sp. SCN 64-44]|mgnify:CR=1 FL=1|nr:MAG: hypothetical protein ABS76_00790 [Pelagibacterium sp. SCN 64-44]